jgi:PPE-repeat protein
MTAASDFALIPPELNSGRIYSGPGAGPMLAAASAWSELAADLHATASSYGSVLAELVGDDWHGPASASMAAAVSPYIAWMTATAAQAEQTALQAAAAAGAFEIAFAETVPPPVIADNRARLMVLVATNIMGQNTPAIAATEAQYAELWAQDAGAMYGYAGASAAASQLRPFAEPLRTTNPSGLSQLISFVPTTLRQLASPWKMLAPGSGSVAGGPLGLLNALSGTDTAMGKFLNSTLLNTLSATGFLAPANTIGPFMGLLGTGAGAGSAEALSNDAVAAGLGNAVAGPVEGMGSLGTLTGSMGNATTVGKLSVPPSWTVAAPSTGHLASSSVGTPMVAPPPSLAAGMPLGGTMPSKGFNRAVPQYGVRPHFVAHPYSAG